MLPNHAPLVIAEQFATLEALHPGRIDLGLGRAPGHRPAYGSSPSPEPGPSSRLFSRRRGRADWLPPTPRGGVAAPFRHPGQRLPARSLASRVLHLQRATGGNVGTAFLLRLSLRAGSARPGSLAVPLYLSTVDRCSTTRTSWSRSRCSVHRLPKRPATFRDPRRSAILQRRTRQHRTASLARRGRAVPLQRRRGGRS